MSLKLAQAEAKAKNLVKNSGAVERLGTGR